MDNSPHKTHWFNNRKASSSSLWQRSADEIVPAHSYNLLKGIFIETLQYWQTCFLLQQHNFCLGLNNLLSNQSENNAHLFVFYNASSEVVSLMMVIALLLLKKQNSVWFSFSFFLFCLLLSKNSQILYPIKTFIHSSVATWMLSPCQSQKKTDCVAVWGLLTLCVTGMLSTRSEPPIASKWSQKRKTLSSPDNHLLPLVTLSHQAWQEIN